MRLRTLLMLGLFLPVVLACEIFGMRVTPTEPIQADSFYFGRAWIDANRNGKIDPADAPLAGAQFTIGISGGITDADGRAVVTIPGGWNQPVSARMAAPEGSGYTLIGPEEVILQPDGSPGAEFLFAEPGDLQNTPAIPGTPTPMITPTYDGDPSQAGAVLRDRTYCSPLPDVNLLMDLYQPDEKKEPSPVVVYIHGGGWIGGDKNDWAGALFVNELRRQGYLVASINYRLAPQYQFPAQIEDVKCAIRYLRARSNTYQLDPQRIGVLGASAGGHLAALLGTSDESAGFDVGEYLDESSRVQAVVDLFGPADLVRLMAESRRSIGERVFGVSEMDPERINPFSPVTHITPDDPPFLILHGERDELVPLDQSETLHERLIASGVSSELIIVRNAGHAFRPLGGQPQPGLPELVAIVEQFLEKNLK